MYYPYAHNTLLRSVFTRMAAIWGIEAPS